MTAQSFPDVRLSPDIPVFYQDDALWDRIKAHPLDKPDAEMPFSARLARDNGWPHAFAQRVIGEYRRFIYLACIAHGEVTPSDEVDQAWHLHLAYSRDYWEEFCPNVLRRPLHHGPTEGGKMEKERYETNYQSTLDLYERVFGAKPPLDIWPPAQIRFGYAEDYARVNRGIFTVTPRTKLKAPGHQSPLAYLFQFALLIVFTGMFFYIVKPFEPFDNPIELAVRIIFTIVIVSFWWNFIIIAIPSLRRGFQRVFRSKGEERVSQPQHGYNVVFTVGVASGVVIVASVEVEGDGSGEGGSGDNGDSSDGGGSGCGGGCGGCG